MLFLSTILPNFELICSKTFNIYEEKFDFQIWSKLQYQKMKQNNEIIMKYYEFLFECAKLVKSESMLIKWWTKDWIIWNVHKTFTFLIHKLNWITIRLLIDVIKLLFFWNLLLRNHVEITYKQTRTQSK